MPAKRNHPRNHVVTDALSGRWLIQTVLDPEPVLLDLDARTATFAGTTHKLLEVFDVVVGDDLLLDLEVDGHLETHRYLCVVEIVPLP